MVWSTWSYIYIHEYIYICVYLIFFQLVVWWWSRLGTRERAYTSGPCCLVTHVLGPDGVMHIYIHIYMYAYIYCYICTHIYIVTAGFTPYARLQNAALCPWLWGLYINIYTYTYTYIYIYIYNMYVYICVIHIYLYLQLYIFHMVWYETVGLPDMRTSADREIVGGPRDHWGKVLNTDIGVITGAHSTMTSTHIQKGVAR